MAPSTISVIGSLNIDFITNTTHLPAAGETLEAQSFATGFGGKGANQAVAAARLARPRPSSSSTTTTTTTTPAPLRIRMLGNVGADSFGRDYVEALAKEGIDASGVRQLEGQQTGVTNIIVEKETGENRILFVPNANYRFGEEREGGGWDLVERGQDGDVAGKGEVVVFQLEIPLRVVLHNLRLASQLHKHTILNPAPAVSLPATAYASISTLILNETEASILSPDSPPTTPTTPVADLQALATSFLDKGVQATAIITLGGRGLVYSHRARGAAGGGEVQTGYIPAEKVRVLDTTAAGDTFVGAYAVQLARAAGAGAGEFEVDEALRFANCAAALSVQRAGAMAAIPYLDEL